jgi:hypothetical protein
MLALTVNGEAEAIVRQDDAGDGGDAEDRVRAE